jgi:hypothetical protein
VLQLCELEECGQILFRRLSVCSLDTAGTNAMPSYLSMARVAKPSGSLQVRGGERGTPL